VRRGLYGIMIGCAERRSLFVKLTNAITAMIGLLMFSYCLQKDWLNSGVAVFEFISKCD
jgi:hypothetical protein